jgi:DNA-binding CsgD family transcriptional regulator
MTHARRLPSPGAVPGAPHWAATEPVALAAPACGTGGEAGEADAGAADEPAGDLLRVGMPRLMRKLLEARSAREREQHVGEALQACGFDWCDYGTLENTPQGLQPRSFVGTYANGTWVQRYFGARHYEVDPRLAEAAASGLPLVWDTDLLQARTAGAAEPARLQRMVDDLHDSGIRSGVLFNVPGAAGPALRTVVALSSSTAGSEWIVDRILGQALTFALSMHEFHVRYTRLPAAPGGPAAADAEALRAPLTAVQQEVLRGLEHGLSDKEIAAQLGISTYAVDYHMRQLRKQFGVRNRVQLASAGAAAGADPASKPR